MRKMMPVARRVLGENDETTSRIKWTYAMALYSDDRATLGDLHEAVTTLEDVASIARRVHGGAHPTSTGIGAALREARAALAARETELAAQDAFRTARVQLAQERSELATTLADASARPSQDA